jgi:hypothetical protein
MEKGATEEAALALVASLQSHGILLSKAKAPWHLVAPSKILLKIGGRAFSAMASPRVEFHQNRELSVAVLPNETILDGKPELVGRAHAFCTEVYAPRPVIQTFSPGARELEARIQRLWSIYRDQPHAHRESPILRARLAEVSSELTSRTLPWDEYQTIYRLLLQLDRALTGKPPLLDKLAPKSNHQEKTKMATERIALPSPRTMTKPPDRVDAVLVPVEGMTNRQLLGHVVDNATLLAKKEIELAKSELRKDLTAEISMAKGLGVAGVCALCTLNMFLVAAAFALAHVVADWAAALIVAAAVLAVGTIAGTVGWKKRVTSPMESTRRSLKEDARWARERLA